MCIRDRFIAAYSGFGPITYSVGPKNPNYTGTGPTGPFIVCLLYTSDAADEEDSVDLGGRRNIKKKKKKKKKKKHHN